MHFDSAAYNMAHQKATFLFYLVFILFHINSVVKAHMV